MSPERVCDNERVLSTASSSQPARVSRSFDGMPGSVCPCWSPVIRTHRAPRSWATGSVSFSHCYLGAAQGHPPASVPWTSASATSGGTGPLSTLSSRDWPLLALAGISRAGISVSGCFVVAPVDFPVAYALSHLVYHRAGPLSPGNVPEQPWHSAGRGGGRGPRPCSQGPTSGTRVCVMWWAEPSPRLRQARKTPVECHIAPSQRADTTVLVSRGFHGREFPRAWLGSCDFHRGRS